MLDEAAEESGDALENSFGDLCSEDESSSEEEEEDEDGSEDEECSSPELPVKRNALVRKKTIFEKLEE